MSDFPHIGIAPRRMFSRDPPPFTRFYREAADRILDISDAPLLFLGSSVNDDLLDIFVK